MNYRAAKIPQTKRPAPPPAFVLPTRQRRWGASTGRLATAGEADLFPEVVETDRPDHHLLADHVARRAVHAHCFGELEVFLDRGAHLRARKVLLDPRGIEAGLLGGCHRAHLVRGAPPAEQLLVEIEIFLAAGILHAHGDGDL